MSETASAAANEQPKEITSTPAHLKLIEFKPEVYAGITAGHHLVVVFPEDKPITGLEGDQGVGKSSVMACLRALCGQEEVANAINAIEKTKRASLTFEKEGRQYIAKITKSDFTLTELQPVEGKEPIKKEIRKPKEVLKTLIGPLGTDPNFLKSKNPQEQMKWLREIIGAGAEYSNLETQITDKYKTAYSDRTNVNRDVARYQSALTETVWYQLGSNKELTTTPVFAEAEVRYSVNTEDRDKDIQTRFDAAKKKGDDLLTNNNNLDNKTRDRERGKTRMEELERELLQVKTRDSELFDEIQVLQKFKADNANAQSEFDAVSKEMRESGEFKLSKKAFEDAQANYGFYKTNLAQSLNLNGKLQALTLQRQKLLKEITPNIPELEVCVPYRVDLAYEREMFLQLNKEATEHEVEAHLATLKDETREGIYYKKHSVSELSESELWDLWLQLCNIAGVSAVFIENVTSLGSDAIMRINELTQRGCYIFYSAMERGVKELKITFHNQLV